MGSLCMDCCAAMRTWSGVEPGRLTAISGGNGGNGAVAGKENGDRSDDVVVVGSGYESGSGAGSGAGIDWK